MFYVRNPKMVQLFEDFDANETETDNSILPNFLKKNSANAKALMCSKIDTNGKDKNDSDLLITFNLDLFRQKRQAEVNISTKTS